MPFMKISRSSILSVKAPFSNSWMRLLSVCLAIMASRSSFLSILLQSTKQISMNLLQGLHLAHVFVSHQIALP